MLAVRQEKSNMQGRKGAQKKAFDSKHLFGQNFLSRDPVMELKI